MSLEKDIEQDYKEAFKAKQQTEVATLRMLRSALKNLIIDKKTDSLSDEDVLSIVKTEIKKRKDSVESYRKGGRDDLASQEEAEIKVLEKYMPEMMSEEEISKIVDGILASGEQNFGLVMKGVMAKSQGRADGQVVQKIVKEKLQT